MTNLDLMKHMKQDLFLKRNKDMKLENVKELIRSVPNFPKPGIIFKDITPVLENPQALYRLAGELSESIIGIEHNKIAGIESRGFIFGSLMSTINGKGLILARKPGKLPAEKITVSYQLEYGSSEIEMHKDSINPGDKVIIHDDLLATGGTALACAKLVTQLGGEVVGFSFIIELEGLNGASNISKEFKNIPVISIFQY
jgi:adenine phosphoribosyltransferase